MDDFNSQLKPVIWFLWIEIEIVTEVKQKPKDLKSYLKLTTLLCGKLLAVI